MTMHRSGPYSVLVATLGVVLASAPRSQALAEGYAQTVRALPPSTGVTLLLHDRSARLGFDGLNLSADDGLQVRNLLTFPSLTFGSFLCQVDAMHVVLGENSRGDLWLVDLVHGGGTVIANLPLNYDAVAWTPGRILVSAKTGGFAAPDNEIHLVDVAQHTTDLIAVLPGASGPLAIVPGGVVYATASAAFPVPPGSVEVLFLRDDQLRSAIGPTHLTRTDAALRFAGIDTASSIAFDDDGDLFYVDWLNAVVGEVDFDPGFAPRRHVLVDFAGSAQSPVAVQFLPLARSSVFEPFQPDAPPGLFVLDTDWISGNTEVLGIAPRRARLSTSPVSPIPTGPFAIDLRGAAASGFAVMAFGPDLRGAETPFHLAGFEQPLFWDIDLFHAFESILIPLDIRGTVQVSLTNPGVGVRWPFVAQAAFVDAAGLVIGSSAPLPLVLQ